MTHRLLLDTDIGTDVDDSLALAVILGSPEVELVGITTVYGDTLLRAKIARRLLDLAGARPDLPVIPGQQMTLSGRPVWWPGHEGRTYGDLGSADVTADTSAADFLVAAAAAEPGSLDLIAIGPLTNVAAAIRLDPEFAENLRSIHVMGAEFAGGSAEHNIRSDSAAAQVVFDTNASVTVTPVDITRKIRLHQDQIGRIGSAGALGETLKAEIDQWIGLQANESFSVPHDATNVVALIRPDLFTMVDGDVKVTVSADFDHADDGATRLEPAADRSTRIITAVRSEDVTAEIIARICRANPTC